MLAQLRAGKLAVRQKPGPTNALGLIKLIFPNENNVYLTARLRSCSRAPGVTSATDAFALKSPPNWPRGRCATIPVGRWSEYSKECRSGKDNVTVNLVKRVPVFIVYGTALAYENGEVHFSDDIYGHDAKLAAALAKGYPYP